MVRSPGAGVNPAEKARGVAGIGEDFVSACVEGSRGFEVRFVFPKDELVEGYRPQLTAPVGPISPRNRIAGSIAFTPTGQLVTIRVGQESPTQQYQTLELIDPVTFNVIASRRLPPGG